MLPHVDAADGVVRGDRDPQGRDADRVLGSSVLVLLRRVVP
jgi:hypothetical protein